MMPKTMKLDIHVSNINNSIICKVKPFAGATPRSRIVNKYQQKIIESVIKRVHASAMGRNCIIHVRQDSKNKYKPFCFLTFSDNTSTIMKPISEFERNTLCEILEWCKLK